jgi:hypothetical protein
MPAPLLQVTYVSSAAHAFSAEELLQLLAKARACNAALGITGMLIYLEGNFLQIVEGESTAVHALCRKIADDPRHRGMLTLMTRSIARRAFSEWSMGFKGPDDLGAEERSAFTSLVQLLATPGMSVTDDRVVNTVLKTFVSNNSV